MIRLYAGLAVAALLIALAAGAYYSANHWCNARCESLEASLEKSRTEVAQFKKERDTARSLASDMAVLWSNNIKASAAALHAQQEKDNAEIDSLRVEANRLRGRVTTVSADYDRLLRYSADRARAATAPPGSVVPAAEAVAVATAPGTLVVYDEGELSAFNVEKDSLYVTLYRKWDTCVKLYNAARDAQIKATQ